MDKVREQYKAQKEEEEERKRFYHSPDTVRKEGTDGAESSEGGDSVEHSSEFTPEDSPAPQLRTSSPQEASPHPSPLATHRLIHNPQANGSTSPREVKVRPEVAPRPKLASSQQAAGGRLNTEGQTAYNPYPPPTTAAPPSPPSADRTPVVTPTSLASATAISPPTVPGGSPTADKEALFAYAWYHGSIARDEALRRLENAGGFDG